MSDQVRQPLQGPAEQWPGSGGGGGSGKKWLGSQSISGVQPTGLGDGLQVGAAGDVKDGIVFLARANGHVAWGILEKQPIMPAHLLEPSTVRASWE